MFAVLIEFYNPFLNRYTIFSSQFETKAIDKRLINLEIDEKLMIMDRVLTKQMGVNTCGKSFYDTLQCELNIWR